MDGRIAPAGDPVPPHLESVQPLQQAIVAGAQGGEVGAAQHDAVEGRLFVRLGAVLEIVEEAAAAPGNGGRTFPGRDFHRAGAGCLVSQAGGEEAPRLGSAGAGPQLRDEPRGAGGRDAPEPFHLRSLRQRFLDLRGSPDRLLQRRALRQAKLESEVPLVRRQAARPGHKGAAEQGQDDVGGGRDDEEDGAGVAEGGLEGSWERRHPAGLATFPPRSVKGRRDAGAPRSRQHRHGHHPRGHRHQESAGGLGEKGTQLGGGQRDGYRHGGGGRRGGESPRPEVRPAGHARGRERQGRAGRHGQGCQSGDVQGDAGQQEAVRRGGDGGGRGETHRQGAPAAGKPGACGGGEPRGEQAGQGQATDQPAQGIGLAPAHRALHPGRQMGEPPPHGAVHGERRRVVRAPDEESPRRSALKAHHHGCRFAPGLDLGERGQRHRSAGEGDGQARQLARSQGHHRPAPFAAAAPAEDRHAQRQAGLLQHRFRQSPGIDRAARQLDPELLVRHAERLDGAHARQGPDRLGRGAGAGFVARCREPDDRQQVPLALRGDDHPQGRALRQAGAQPGELRVEPGGLALGIGAGGESYRQLGAVRPHLSRDAAYPAQRAHHALDGFQPLAGQLGGVAVLAERQAHPQLGKAAARKVVERQARQGDASENQQGQRRDQPSDGPVGYRGHRVGRVRCVQR